MFLYNSLKMTYTWGRNWLPQNQHSQKNELCVTGNFVMHLDILFICSVEGKTEDCVPTPRDCHWRKIYCFLFFLWRSIYVRMLMYNCHARHTPHTPHTPPKATSYSAIRFRQAVLKLWSHSQARSMVCDNMTCHIYEGWNFNSGNYLFTTDTKQIQVSKFYCPSV